MTNRNNRVRLLLVVDLVLWTELAAGQFWC